MLSLVCAEEKEGEGRIDEYASIDKVDDWVPSPGAVDACRCAPLSRYACQCMVLGQSKRRSASTIQDAPNVRYRCQVGEERDQVRQLCVVGVIKPRGHRHGVIRVEDIRCRRIVENDGVGYGSTKL